VRISTVEFLLSEEEYKFLWGMMNSITAQLAAVAQQAPVQPVPQQVSQVSAGEPGATSKGMVYSVCGKDLFILKSTCVKKKKKTIINLACLSLIFSFFFSFCPFCLTHLVRAALKLR
jgi:hypothetical protein